MHVGADCIHPEEYSLRVFFYSYMLISVADDAFSVDIVLFYPQATVVHSSIAVAINEIIFFFILFTIHLIVY